jgi:hypothetical protein
MTYKEGTEGTDGTWSLPKTFPGMTREDSYKAVYAPNYVPSSEDNTKLELKSDAQPATAEYLTCEGKKPINISFKRDYARIRLYTGGLTGSYKTTFDATAGFKSDDDFNYMESSMSGYTYTFTPDEYDNAYLYGTWRANGAYIMGFNTDFTTYDYLYLGPKYTDYALSAASSPNKSYVLDLSYATLNLDEATAAATTVTDWSSVVNAGITKVKMVGAWNSSYRHSFSAITYTDNAKITSIDLSGVTGLDNSNLPSSFCSGCSNLSEVKLPNDLKVVNSNMFQYCSNLKEIDIPSSVTSIGDYAFYGCSSLESIELPQGLETIYSYAFRNCSSLKKVVCKATTPPKLREAIFDYTPDDKVLYVPDDCVETYKTADAATSRFVVYVAWKDVFGDNIKSIKELTKDE